MWLKTLAFVLTAVFVIAAATMVPTYAQQAQNNPTDDDTIALPVSAILDSALNTHEQDIKEKIFEYKFESAKESPAAQADLVIARSEELKKAAGDKEDLMNALMAKDGSISDEQLAAIAEETNKSMEKLNGWSKKLEKHAGEVSSWGDHNSYFDSVKPLMNNINGAQMLARNISQAAKDRIARDKKDKGNNSIQFIR